MKLTVERAKDLLLPPGKGRFSFAVKLVGYREAAYWARRFHGGIVGAFATPGHEEGA